MSNLIWLNTKVKILINRVILLAEVHSLINSNIVVHSYSNTEVTEEVYKYSTHHGRHLQVANRVPIFGGDPSEDSDTGAEVSGNVKQNGTHKEWESGETR